jgi:hypothetical protein
MTSGANAEARFDKSDFVYIAKDNEYQCPAGERAIYRFTREENGLQIPRMFRRDFTRPRPEAVIAVSRRGRGWPMRAFARAFSWSRAG